MRTIVALAALVFAVAVAAQDFPSRTARMIVPNAPGGPVDSVSRVLSQHLAKAWQQPVIVENRPGAGGNIGTDAVAKAVPDGYTLLVTPSGPIVANKWLYRSLPFDPERDLAPVSLLYSTPLIITVPASLPANTIGELIRYIKERPGKLNFASGGVGTPVHLAGELLKQAAGLDIVHVLYKGGPQMTAAVVSGGVVFNFNGLIAMPLVQAGKLKALGLAALRRTPLAPEVPTFGESGGPSGFEVNAWGGLFAPAGTPPALIKRLRDDFAAALQSPENRTRLHGIGVEPVGNTPSEFAEQIRAESAHWARVIKTAGIAPQ
jgi:tripartite-type tricarboxylate transporter receptor subunit TctC